MHCNLKTIWEEDFFSEFYCFNLKVAYRCYPFWYCSVSRFYVWLLLKFLELGSLHNCYEFLWCVSIIPYLSKGTLWIKEIKTGKLPLKPSCCHLWRGKLLYFPIFSFLSLVNAFFMCVVCLVSRMLGSGRKLVRTKL